MNTPLLSRRGTIYTAKRTTSRRCATFVLSTFLLFETGSNATATSYIWDGGGADDLWTTAANWSPDSAPISGTETAITIAKASVRRSPIIDSDFTIGTMTVNCGSFTLSGAGTLSIYGATNWFTPAIINTNADTMTISNNINLVSPTGTNRGVGFSASSGDIRLGNINTNGRCLGLLTNAGKTVIVDGVVSGAGGLYSSGQGTVVLNTANSYTGATSIQSGTVLISTDSLNGQNGAFGNSTDYVTLGSTSASGTSVSLMASGAVTIGRNIRLETPNSGTGTYLIGQTTADTFTLSGMIRVASGATVAQPLTIASVKGGRINVGSIARMGATGNGDALRVIGGGTVALTGMAYDYSGDTTVSDSTTLMVTGNIGAVATGPSVYITPGASLCGSGTIARAVVVTDGTVNSSGMTLSSTTSFSGVSYLSGTANTNGGVVVSSGTLVLNGTSTGSMKVSSGATLAGSGRSSNSVTVDGGTVNGSGLIMVGAVTFTGSSNLIGITNAYSNVSIASGTVVLGGTISVPAGRLTIANGASLGGNGRLNGYVVSNGGVINGNGLNIVGSGTFSGNCMLAGSNTITGGAMVTSGTLSISGSNSSALSIQSSAQATNDGVWNGTVNVATGAVLNGTGSVLGSVSDSGVISGNLTFKNDVTVNAGATASAAAFNGNITNNGTITSAVNVLSGKTFNGSGIVNADVVNSGAIAGALTFNQNITVNAGATASASAFNGNIANNGTITSAVNVQSGKTLSGTGTVSNSVTVLSGGKTSAGNGTETGVMTLDLTYNSGAAANFNVSSIPSGGSPVAQQSGLAYSQIVVSGSAGAVNLQIGEGTAALQMQADGSSNSGVTLQVSLSLADFNKLVASASQNYVGGGANGSADNLFLFTLGDGLVAGTFQMLDLIVDGVDYTGSIYYSGANDRFDGIANLGDVTVSVGGITQEFAISYIGNSGLNTTNGGNDVVLTAVPEPNTWATLISGLGLLTLVQRMRHRK